MCDAIRILKDPKQQRMSKLVCVRAKIVLYCEARGPSATIIFMAGMFSPRPEAVQSFFVFTESCSS